MGNGQDSRTEHTENGRSRKKGMNPVFMVLYVVLLCVFLYSGYRIVKILGGYLAGRQQYSQTAGQFASENDGTETDDGSETEPVDEGPFASVAPISVDWDALLEKNPEVVGWIYCPDTVVNYPVLRASDNDKYLHTMVDGRYNAAGSIFMDCYSDPQLMDLVTMIYGHHMQDGSMFAMLHNYVKQSYYDEHPCMWYLTPDADYRLDLYSGYVTGPDAEIYNLFTEKEQLEAYLEYASSHSTFKPMIEFPEIPDIGHIFVLSTCAYEFNDARYLVVGVPVRVR